MLAIEGPIDDILGLPGVIGDVVNFWSDPFGNMYTAGREAVLSLSRDMIPAITESTLPDLTLPSFLSAYAVSFALSIFAAVILLIIQLVRTAQGRQSGRETIDSIGLYFPGFVAGVMFGPAIGLLIVEFVRALSRSLIDFAYRGTVSEMVDTFGRIMVEDPSLIAGTAGIGFMVVWAMAMGLLLIVGFFIIQLILLYFSGILIPLAAVWIIDPQRRQGGTVAISLWIGMLFVHPLLFFILGFAFRLAIDGTGSWGDDGWRNLVNMLVSCVAIFMAVLSPLFLIGFVRKAVAGQGSTGGTSSIAPIGARSLQSAPRSTGERSAAPASQRVRVSAPPNQARGATSVGAQSVGATSVGTARGGVQKTAARGGVATVTKSAAPAAAIAQGVKTVSRKTTAEAQTGLTAPPRETHGKDRPS